MARICTLFILSVHICFCGSAQLGSRSFWNGIEESIDNIKNLGNALDSVRIIKKLAIEQKDYANFSRAAWNELKITDIRTEDSLFFRNSAFIDDILLSEKQPAELKMFMHILQARRIRFFKSKHLSFNRATYETKNQASNYASFTNQILDSLIVDHLGKAKKIAPTIPSPAPQDIIWISSDPGLFLFVPGLYDIISGEQIINNPIRWISPDLSHTIRSSLSMPPDEFASWLDSLTNSSQLRNSNLGLYHSWLQYHIDKKDSPDEPYYFIETLAHKYAFSLFENDSASDADYKKYLHNQTISSFAAVKAHAIYQLCLLWNADAAKYAPSYNRYAFDTSYAKSAAMALQLYEENKTLISRFPHLAYMLELMKTKILSKSLSLRMDDTHLPGKPILSQLSYKNIPTCHYRIVRLNLDEQLPNKERKAIEFLLAKKSERESLTELISFADHNEHTVFLKIDPLAAGRFYLLLSDKKIEAGDTSLKYIGFSVTDIAIVNSDRKIFILNRESGKPLQNVTVVSHTDEQDKNKITITTQKTYQTAADGTVLIKGASPDRLSVYVGADSVRESFNSEEDRPTYNKIYDHENDNNLDEYYDDNITAQIFTDRSIYRPGQTVQYKLIFLTTNPRTGEIMLLNKQNMRQGFKNYFKRWIKDNGPELNIIDPFRRKIDTVQININDYGSFNGSFKIPRDAATGEWQVYPRYMANISGNDGRFRVEEYKRPGYDIIIEKTKKEVRPGDRFSFKIKLKSFSGADLNNVNIQYTVARSGVIPNQNGTVDNDIIDSSAYTNSKGELEILVDDSLLRSTFLPIEKNWRYTYDLDIEATDETGESYEEREQVIVSTRPLTISFPIDKAYSRDKLPHSLIQVKHENAGVVSKKVKIRVFKLDPLSAAYQENNLVKADQWLYSKTELSKWFPAIKFEEQKSREKMLIFETTINTADYERLLLPPDKIVAGTYSIEASVEENGRVTGSTTKAFSVYDLAENKLPEPSFSFDHLAVNTGNPGDTVKMISGSAKDIYIIRYRRWYAKSKSGVTLKRDYDTQFLAKGLTEWKFQIPADAIDKLMVTTVFILDNAIYRKEETIYLPSNIVEPKIVVESHRQTIYPGAEEKFTVSVVANKEKIAAEILTTIYDASLDKIEPHDWRPTRPRTLPAIRSNWPVSIHNSSTTNVFTDKVVYVPDLKTNTAYWWLEDRGGNGMINYMPGNLALALTNKVSGLTVNNQSLDQVVVVGYGTVKRSDVTGSISMVRTNSLKTMSQQWGKNKPLIILDGVIYEGDPDKIDISLITSGALLEDDPSKAIYGSRAVHGVLLLSTKGEIVLPIAKFEEPPVKIRKNFDETAFFAPAIYAGKDGNFSFSFTIPETLTEWKWKLLAHTRDALFTYEERKLYTQLPLMVQPNMPRLLYQGDKIILKTRISNLDTLSTKGIASCTIEDAVTGEDITSLLVKQAKTNFSVDAKSNSVANFSLQVPASQLNPLKIIIKASNQKFADGEEHIIPVLSGKVLVKKQTAFHIDAQKDSTINLPALTTGKEVVGMGLFVASEPSAALINSLPFLANYSFDCAEQTFNKMLANIMALQIMRADSTTREMYTRAKQVSSSVQSDSVPDQLSEQTMPWLNLPNKNSRQQKQLLALLDTFSAKTTIQKHLANLGNLQNTDGGFTWFNGGKSNPYISVYLMTGFGKLFAAKWALPNQDYGAKKIDFARLVSFNDEELIDKPSLFNIYARSLWKDKYPVNDSLLKIIQAILKKEWAGTERKSLYNQALLILSTSQWFEPGTETHIKAITELENIRESAIVDELNGTRWKEIADDNDLIWSSEETLELLIEAFEKLSPNNSVNSGIIKWLLSAKTEHEWSTTKGTAAAIRILQKTKGTVTGVPASVSVNIGGKELKVSNDMLSGQPFSFVKTSIQPASVIVKAGTSSANGNIITAYLSPANQLEGTNETIVLKKQLFRLNESTDNWEEITTASVLKIADQLKVTLTIETNKPLQFVYIDDKRSGSLEPIDNTSGYEYGEGFSWYKSVRDAGCQFFADFIPPGRVTINYGVKVSQEGQFTNGPAKLECMYKPGLNAYSNSAVISVRGEK